jgi:hypothetical protein
MRALERDGVETLTRARDILDDPTIKITESDRSAMMRLIESIQAGLLPDSHVNIPDVAILKNYVNQYSNPPRTI